MKKSAIIITAAILTSMPRWIIALLAGEGILLPDEWKVVWTIISAILAASMAIVEGVAFANIFQAWRNQSGKAADTLLYLAIASAGAFVLTLAPSMAASVRGVTMSEFIQNDVILLLWTTSLALSTILIVISVGYSEKVTTTDPKLKESREEVKRLEQEIKHAQDMNEKASEWEWLLNDSSKKEKIKKYTELYPELPTNAVAILTDSSETYVSQHRSKK